ncbi:hypothetical protein Efla_002500 [Eimeria flavescens]
MDEAGGLPIPGAEIGPVVREAVSEETPPPIQVGTVEPMISLEAADVEAAAARPIAPLQEAIEQAAVESADTPETVPPGAAFETFQGGDLREVPPLPQGREEGGSKPESGARNGYPRQEVSSQEHHRIADAGSAAETSEQLLPYSANRQSIRLSTGHSAVNNSGAQQASAALESGVLVDGLQEQINSQETERHSIQAVDDRPEFQAKYDQKRGSAEDPALGGESIRTAVDERAGTHSADVVDRPDLTLIDLPHVSNSRNSYGSIRKRTVSQTIIEGNCSSSVNKVPAEGDEANSRKSITERRSTASGSQTEKSSASGALLNNMFEDSSQNQQDLSDEAIEDQNRDRSRRTI